MEAPGDRLEDRVENPGLDGGRIFRALLSRRVGFRRATDVSVKVSRVVSIAFAVFGLAFMQLQLLLLAGVLWSMASAESRMAQQFGAGYTRERYTSAPITRQPFGGGANLHQVFVAHGINHDHALTSGMFATP